MFFKSNFTLVYGRYKYSSRGSSTKLILGAPSCRHTQKMAKNEQCLANQQRCQRSKHDFWKERSKSRPCTFSPANKQTNLKMALTWIIFSGYHGFLRAYLVGTQPRTSMSAMEAVSPNYKRVESMHTIS